MIMVVYNNVLAGAAGSGGAAAYTIERSLRFERADDAYLSKTFAAGNRKIWTFSCWAKLSEVGTNRELFCVPGANPWITLQIANNDKFYVSWTAGTSGTPWQSDALFRDPSAWYHFVVAWDTTQSTPANRLKVYANGVQLTGNSSYPDHNTDYQVNSAVEHGIGGNKDELGGYLTEIHFVDGQALAASDFGEYDDNGVWQPKRYSGTYGTNGFHLDFSDDSSNSALGTDSSDNNNDWTVNNLVASAGLSTANQGFDVVTYSGSGSTQSVDSLAFQPDFVWIKNRDQSEKHALSDSVRGIGKVLYSNSTAGEDSGSTYSDRFVSFDSDGFTVGSSHTTTNSSGDDFVAWCWKAGGTAASNTDGSITSSVSANSEHGFSIVSYTGTGANATVGHGLSSAPKWIIVKDRSQATGWAVYHDAIGTSTSNYIELQSAGASGQDDTAFQDTAPTNSVFSIGTKAAVNEDGDDFIAYCWSEISGFSKFGSYTGTGSAHDVELGFKPKYLIYKCSSSGTTNWHVYDSERNNADSRLIPNLTSADSTSDTYAPTFTDTGFTVAAVTDTHTNASGETYIYAAFADKPPGQIIDSLIDTPTNYEADSGNNGGNHCTWNPLTMSRGNMSDGNLLFYGDGTNTPRVNGTISQSSGKWYYEATVLNDGPGTGSGDVHNSIGWGLDTVTQIETAPNTSAMEHSFYFMDSGWYKNFSGSNTDTGNGKWLTGDIIGVAADLDDNTITFYRNGTSVLSQTIGVTAGTRLCPAHQSNTGTYGRLATNFGQRPFQYPPGGTGGPAATFKALCTQNFDDPLISDGSTAFDAVAYSGTGAAQSIDLGFSPDLVWTKQRSGTEWNYLIDTVRGNTKALFSNETDDEFTTNDQVLTAFNSDGYSLGTDSAVNDSSSTYIGWAWDGGTSTVSNTDGSVTASVRANQTAGFSICTFTSPSSGTFSFGHGLNAAPELVLVKTRGATSDWSVYHASVVDTTSKYLVLNKTDALATYSTIWGSALPTSSVVGLTSGGAVATSQTCVAYCFAPVEGYSAFGSFEGTGADDNFVYTGFRSRLVWIKEVDNANPWYIYDTVRNTYNTIDNILQSNSSSDESTIGAGDGTNQNGLQIFSNGFAIPHTLSGTNRNGSTYIFCAWAENPLKTARAR